MSEKIKISVVMHDEKPNVKEKEKNTNALALTQETDMTIMSVLLQNHLMSGSFCGGRGDCGRCVIQFLDGAPLPTGVERARLTPKELRQGYRLACVAKPKRDCVIRIVDRDDRDMPIVTEVNLPSEFIDLNSRKKNLSEKQKPDAMEFPGKDEKKEKATLSCNGRYMIAVDLGTTTIAMQLRDVETGEAADTYCEKNPQSIYGTDVLARIEASCNGNRAELQKLVCESLARGLRQFMECLRGKQCAEDTESREARLSENGEEGAQILCMCIAGNTVMEHLLLGYDVEGLGKAPFAPVEKGLQKVSLPGMDFPVYVVPCISAFVGGDVVAGLYALHMLPPFHEQKNDRRQTAEDGMGVTPADREREENGTAALLIDLGTNGEMAITDGRRMLVTATAAGPAFEGRGDLIGTDRIALTAELLRRGILDETGLMAEPYFEEGVRLELTEKNGTEEKRGRINREKAKKYERYFRKEDVRALQMAKAAVRAGVEILWEEMGRPSIKRIYLAGGFGYYLDVEASVKIGLLPAYMRGRVQAVGNTSLAGAYELGRALSKGETSGEILEKRLSYIESMNLAKKSAFEGLYLKYMNLEEN